MRFVFGWCLTALGICVAFGVGRRRTCDPLHWHLALGGAEHIVFFICVCVQALQPNKVRPKVRHAGRRELRHHVQVAVGRDEDDACGGALGGGALDAEHFEGRQNLIPPLVDHFRPKLSPLMLLVLRLAEDTRKTHGRLAGHGDEEAAFAYTSLHNLRDCT